MDDDSSNDVVIASTPTASVQNANKPLMQFFRRLIVSHGSQNTVLTNAQLEEILTKEFDIKIHNLHPLLSDIYINVLKKYLKDWPLWGEFDKTIKESPYSETLLVKLVDKYHHLKSYLWTMLDASCDLSVECVKKVEEETEEATEEPVKEDTSLQDVVLEILASRNQLNQFFLRHPDPECSSTLFNLVDQTPSQIRLNTASLDSILNWWSIRIQINLQWSQHNNCMFIRRETVHQLEHLLVNKKLPTQDPPITRLNNKIQIRDTRKGKRVPKDEIVACLDFLCKKNKEKIKSLDTIIQFLKKDLQKLPICIAPAEYRRILSKHTYIRYLYADKSTSKPETAKYDLQLKETLTPTHQFAIGKVEGTLDPSLPTDWLKIECISCNATFMGSDIALELKQHFDDNHSIEPDWQCSNCENSYSMQFLAENWWRHDCLL